MGFGFAMITLPLLTIVFLDKTAIPVVLFCTTFVSAAALIEARNHIKLKSVIVLFFAAMPGTLVGIYFLKIVEITTLQIIIGSLVIFCGIASLLGLRKKLNNQRLAFWSCGFASGMLNGSVAMAGPPLVLLFVNQGYSKMVYRANILAYFVLLGCVTMLLYFFGGIITPQAVRLSIVLSPGLVAGTIAGIFLAKKIDSMAFQKIALLIIIISGCTSLVSGLYSCFWGS